MSWMSCCKETLSPELPPGALFFLFEALDGHFSAGPHDRPLEMSTGEIGASQLGITQVSAKERSAVQDGARKVRTPQIGPRHVGATEVAGQVGHAEVRAYQ